MDEQKLPVVYKQVAVKDGKYWACAVDVRPWTVHACVTHLFYKIGEVTVSPTEAGIFCRLHKETAVADALQRKDRWPEAGLAAVLECYPIGDKIEGQPCNFPAVYVIRELWREPKEEWVDVGEECRVDFDPATGYMILYHKETALGALGFEPFAPMLCGKDYRLEYAGGPSLFIPAIRTARIMKRSI